MGSYYKPTCQVDRRIETVELDDFVGSKLMEHSYFNNQLVDKSLFMIESGNWKNRPFQWSCDYDETTLSLEDFEAPFDLDIDEETFTKYELSNPVCVNKINTQFDWNDFKDNDFSNRSYQYMSSSYCDIIILNNTKKEYIDLSEYKYLSPFDRSDLIHPFPLLTNSESCSMGGGDFHPDHDFRGIWSNDCFEIVRRKIDIPLSYKNISAISFYENEDEIELTKNSMKQSILRTNLPTDRLGNFNHISFSSLDKNSKKSEIIEALKQNEISNISFYKTNGELVFRKATLDRDYVSESSSNHDKDTYIWFKDIEGNRLKKFVSKNFVSLEKIS